MSARHRSFTVDASGTDSRRDRLAQAVIPAITECAVEFLSPPIANLGGRGIRTAAKRMPAWFDRVGDPARDLPLIASMMERAGTGGALFRNLYRDFLTESLELVESVDGAAIAERVARGRDLFAESASLWTSTARCIERAGTTGSPQHLGEAGRTLERIAAIETEAMTALASLGDSPEGRPRNTA